MAIQQAIEHRRPGHVADRLDRNPLARGKALLVRQNRQRGVDQGHEPDAEQAHDISPLRASLVMIASATSAIRRLVLIAWLRSSA